MMFGPTLVLTGSEEQRQHHLPKILSDEFEWCQGRSGPRVGSGFWVERAPQSIVCWYAHGAGRTTGRLAGRLAWLEEDGRQAGEAAARFDVS